MSRRRLAAARRGNGSDFTFPRRRNDYSAHQSIKSTNIERKPIMSFRTLSHLLVASLPVIAVGCTKETTSEDVAEARAVLREEQEDLDEARREAMKPVLEDEEAQEAIEEEQQDVDEAQGELNQTQRDFQANQARDAFALEVQKTLDEVDRQIAALETQKDSEEGAAADATQQQIDDLKERRDRVEEKLNEMKREELAQWETHKSDVQLAVNELKSKLDEIQ
jgi:hypothetical protein